MGVQGAEATCEQEKMSAAVVDESAHIYTQWKVERKAGSVSLIPGQARSRQDSEAAGSTLCQPWRQGPNLPHVLA